MTSTASLLPIKPNISIYLALVVDSLILRARLFFSFSRFTARGCAGPPFGQRMLIESLSMQNIAKTADIFACFSPFSSEARLHRKTINIWRKCGPLLASRPSQFVIPAFSLCRDIARTAVISACFSSFPLGASFACAPPRSTQEPRKSPVCNRRMSQEWSASEEVNMRYV